MGPPARQGRLGTPVPPLPRAGPCPGPAPRLEAPAPSQPRNSASPLRARSPAHPLRIRIPGRRGGDGGRGGRGGGTGICCGSGGASLRRPAPAPVQPGRCSPRPRDEPGERGDPPTPPATPARHTVKQTQRRQPRASVSRGCVTLGSPAPSLGLSPEDGQGWRQPFRVPAHRHQSGAREAPWRRGLAQAGRRIRHAGLEGRAPLPTAARP
uniref:Uncharacterized protein n=1 Tax=Rangifer tarandus platyrhynchus TaxID=3082113 RepID=A0ACB0E4V1_RANTA|nr:unnamed protein product [Rangifer tarandus platyrhynchus]